ncbi:MAG: S41 family peptidase, partial [Blastocatellia bacterium]
HDISRAYLSYESRRVAAGIGYIKFDGFAPEVAEKVRADVQSFRDAPGIIIDLRGNPGGIGTIGAEIAGSILEKPATLVKYKTRTATVPLRVHPQKRIYSGSIVILIDGLSRSASEILAAGLQEIGRAKVIGERSPGDCLAGALWKLPTGSILMVPVGDVETPAGKLLEGHGVVPDIEIKLTRAALLAGVDPALQEAIKYIDQQHH